MLIDKKTQACDVHGWTSVAVPWMAGSDRCRLKARRKPSFLKPVGFNYQPNIKGIIFPDAENCWEKLFDKGKMIQ